MVASTRIGIASRGRTDPTPVAKANADAEWPEGNDLLAGIGARRASGTSVVSGRPRRPSGFSTRLAAADATPIEASPVTAARLPRGPRVAARIAAQPSHS